MLRTASNTSTIKPNTEDVKSLMSYSHYLIMKAQLSGNLCFDGHKPTAEETQIAEECRALSGKLSRALDFCKIGEIPELLDYYGITYRIGHKRVPDSNVIRKHKQRVFRAWKAGDKEIVESAVYGMIAPEVTYHPENADKAYLAAYLSLKEKWVATLKKHGRFPKVTTYENYQRLALMMRENPDHEFEGDTEEIKQKWYERNKIDDLTTVSSLILKSYRRFIGTLPFQVIDFEERLQLENRILKELTTRTDLHPSDAEAYRLALHCNKQMME